MFPLTRSLSLAAAGAVLALAAASIPARADVKVHKARRNCDGKKHALSMLTSRTRVGQASSLTVRAASCRPFLLQSSPNVGTRGRDAP